MTQYNDNDEHVENDRENTTRHFDVRYSAGPSCKGQSSEADNFPQEFGLRLLLLSIIYLFDYINATGWLLSRRKSVLRSEITRIFREDICPSYN